LFSMAVTKGQSPERAASSIRDVRVKTLANNAHCPRRANNISKQR